MPASELLCGGPQRVTGSVLFRVHAHIQRESKILSANTLRGKGEDETDSLHLVMRGLISKLKTKLKVLIIVIFWRTCCVPGTVLRNIPPLEGGNIVSLGFEMK